MAMWSIYYNELIPKKTAPPFKSEMCPESALVKLASNETERVKKRFKKFIVKFWLDLKLNQLSF